MHLAHLLGVETTYSHGKLGAILGATGVYVVAVLMLRPASGDSILIAVIVPVLITAWSFGARAALLASLLAIMLNVFFVTVVGDVGMAAWLLGGGALARGAALTGAALVVGHLRDVRERLDHELVERDERHDAHRFLAEMATNMAEGVYLIRASDGIIVYANERFEEMFGYRAGELIGEHVSVVNAPSEKSPGETAQEIIEALNATGSWRGEIRSVKKDGTAFWCQASVSTFEHHEHGVVWVSVHQDITDRKLAQEALRESEELYRALFESTPLGISVTQPKGGIGMRQTNPALERMLGRTKEELEGTRLSDYRLGNYGSTDDHAMPSAHSFKRLASGETDTVRYERELVHSSGKILRVHVTAAAVPSQTGERERVFRLVEDVTEQKLAEEALRESEERFRTLFEAAPVGIALSDQDGRLTAVNPKLARMLRRTADEMRGGHLREFWPGGAQRLGIGRRMRSGADWSEHHTRELKWSAGDSTWARVTAATVQSEDGHLQYAVRIVQDITEQKRAEEALRESEERYRALFEAAPVGIAITDASGIIVQTNSALNRILGRTQDELNGSQLGDFRVDGPPPSENISIRLARAETGTLRYERQFVHRSGETRWADVTAAAAPAQAGQPAQVFRMIEDITERKRAEEALQEAEAERLDRTRHLASIGQLAAGVAHEINNPLNSVMGFTQLVLGDESLSAQARSDLETVYGESQRASKIVQNLLSFARTREPERRPVDVRSVVERACHLKEYDLRKHAIELRTHFQEELPLILGDEQQLTEVMLNLLTNAEQAIASTEQPGVVTVSCDKSDGLVLITVADDGPGIPPEVLGRVFEPFFTTKDVGGGTGLGLSVCQGIIREHEGELWAESTLGGDTTFSITLPVPQAPLTPPRTPEADRRLRPVASMRILVVDDEPLARDLMVRMLAKDNHTVDEASDGNDAWRRIRSTSYDCVIADLRMPGSSGQELYRLVEESDPDLAAKFIFVTGDTMSPDTNIFLSSVAASSLMKPIDIAELRRRVAELPEMGKAAARPEHSPPVAEGADAQGPEQEGGAP